MSEQRIPSASLDGALWHPFAQDPFPGPRTRWVQAEGSFVFDDQGRRLLDGTSSWWCITHGHRHPALVEALATQARQLDHVMLSPHRHPAAERLAEGLLGQFGPRYQRVFFTDNGSTAVEAALRIALEYWARRSADEGTKARTRFASVRLGYHGDTLGAALVGGIDEFLGVNVAAGSETIRATEPYCYRCPLSLQHPSCGIACLDSFEKQLATHGDSLAALIVEPLIMGAAGMVAYPPAYLERIVRAARRAGALVIFDEVFTGFGRTGTMFAVDALPTAAHGGDVGPDLICLSKGLTGGMLALGAVVSTGELYARFRGNSGRKLSYGHTFTGNPLACAVAFRNLQLFGEEGTLDRIGAMAQIFRDAVGSFAALPLVGDVRTLGGVFALELVRDKGTRQKPDPAAGPGWNIAERLWQQGLWLRPLHNTLYFMPPYSTTESDLHRSLALLYAETDRFGRENS